MNRPVSEHLVNLLYEQDCVILAGFGAFVANDEPAYVDFINKQIVPPRREIMFNKAVSNNDGLLINYVAKRENIDYNSAKKEVESFIKNCERELSKVNAKLHFSGIGTLTRNIENNLEFSSYHVNYSTKDFGLPYLNAQPILRNSQLNVPFDHPINRNKQARGAYNRKGSFHIKPWYWGVAASAILLISAPFVLSKIDWNTSKGQQSSVAPFLVTNNDNDNQQEPNTQEPKESESAPDEQNLAATDALLPQTVQMESKAEINDDAESKAEKTAPIREPKLNSKQQKAITENYLKAEEHTKEYIVIIGSFSSDKNVKVLTNKVLKDGFTPYRDKMDNLNRVGIRIAATDSGLEKQMNRIRSKYNAKAWILNQ
jgi:hypothetical protein